MKFMTYNIYNGAIDTLDLVINVIKTENPDVLTLNEANGFDTDNKLKQFAERTNFPYYELGLCGDGDEYHVALLSKLPFTLVKHLGPLSRAAILVSVDDPVLGSIAIVATHLSPYSENARLSESQKILSEIEQYEKKVIMGDINSLAKSDDYSSTLPDSFKEGQLRKFTTDGKLRFDVINNFVNSELADTAVVLNQQQVNTVPTGLNIDAEHSNFRLDYIFISNNMRESLTSYTVIKSESADIASDHYPVCIEIS